MEGGSEKLEFSPTKTSWEPDTFQKDLEGFINKTLQQFSAPKKSDDLVATRTPANVVTRVTETIPYSSLAPLGPKATPTRRASDGDPVDLEELIKRVEDLEGKVEDLESDLTSLESDVTSLEEDVAELQSDLTSLEFDVTFLEEDVQAIKTDISELEEKVETLESEVTRLDYDIAALQDLVDTIIDRLNNASIDASCSASGQVTVTLNL
jgi:chromosome segregation ATPase